MKLPLLVFFLMTPLTLQAESPNPFIMGWGRAGEETLASFLLSRNPGIGQETATRVARTYLEECLMEGINSDLAFAQMILETSALRFGGQVLPQQNNFAGLGALDGGYQGLSFPEERTGIRAHVQHLKAYGSALPLVNDLVNPRFTFVPRAIAPTVYDLSRRWASDPLYGDKIIQLVQKMFEFVPPKTVDELVQSEYN